MARPLTAVFVGGQTKPFRLDERLARILARDLMDLLRSDGGSLFVATSPRTAPGIAEVLKSQLGNRAVIFDWATNPASDNPYHALLRLADRIIVTGDSISMIVEAASLGRPLAIYPLPRGASVLEDLGRRVRYLLFRPRPTGKSAWNTLGLAAHRVGLLGFPRDLEAAHRRLFATGRAVPFGHPFPGEDPGLPDELDIVGLRIRAIHAEQGHNPGDARARI